MFGIFPMFGIISNPVSWVLYYYYFYLRNYFPICHKIGNSMSVPKF